MTEIWNLWDIKPPPVCTVKTKLYFKDMKNLSENVYDALKSLRDITHFDREAAILSRFLYKYKRIFRHDKGIQDLVKVNQCLKRYLKLNMLGVLCTFKQSIPFHINPVSTHIYFPTRQMLKWVLLKLQALSQIFVRVIELTKAAGSYIYKKLYLGWSLYNSFFIFCVTARILVASKYLVAKSIEWYSSFYKYLPYLQETSDYLPGYNFPVDLKLWLGEVDLTPIKKTFIDNISEFIDLVKNDEEEDENEYEKLVNEDFIRSLFKIKIKGMSFDGEEVNVEETEKKIEEVKQSLQTSLHCEDLGVPVKNIKEEIPKKKKKRRRARKRTFSNSIHPERDDEHLNLSDLNGGGKEVASKEINKKKRALTDLIPVEGNKEEVLKKKKKRKRAFTDLVLNGNGKEEALKEIKKRKRVLTGLISVQGNKEEGPKKRKKKNWKKSITGHLSKKSFKSDKEKRNIY